MLPSADVYFGNDFTFKVGTAEFRTLHTPGHTPGSCCFFQTSGEIVFTGDTLFAEGIGRTDFPGGSHRAMQESIALLERELPSSCRIYPGHGGPDTTSAALHYAKMML